MNIKSPAAIPMAAILVALLCPVARAQQKTAPAGASPAPASAPKELQPTQIADGIWASYLPRGANVGWFTISDYVVAIDSGISREEGQRILDAIKKTTKGKPVRYLVITHAHGDHAGGAEAFAAAGATILCQQKAAPAIAGLLYHSPAGAKSLGALDPTLAQIDHMLWISDKARAAQIDHLGPAHTAGDVLIYLPKEKVLFSGDVVVNGTIPFLQSSDADPANWVRILGDISGIPVNQVVPGHGSIGATTGIDATRQYIEHALKVAGDLAAQGISGQQLSTALGQPRYTFPEVRQALMSEHIRNIEAVMRFLKEKKEKEPKAAPKSPAKTPPEKSPGA
jgi:cyclase